MIMKNIVGYVKEFSGRIRLLKCLLRRMVNIKENGEGNIELSFLGEDEPQSPSAGGDERCCGDTCYVSE